MSEDQRLLRRLHRRDVDALRCIYQKYKDDLLTIALSVLGDVHAAEDCLHDVFVSFAKAAGEGRIERSLKGYLISSMFNRARNRLKRRQNELVAEIEEGELPTAPGNPVEQLIDQEKSRRIFKALAQLPDEQQEVVVYHLHGEMKFREIAALLGVSINTVQSRYRYGIEKLRTLLLVEVDQL